MVRENEKGIEYYLALEYPYTVRQDEDEFFVRFPDLPGCMTQVERSEDIHKMAQEIKELWIETALEARQYVPEPTTEEFSGKFVVRVPKTLHRDLVYQAQQEGMSLNSFVLHLLSERASIARFESLMANIESVQSKPTMQSAEKMNSALVDHRSLSYWKNPGSSAGTTVRPRRTSQSQPTKYAVMTANLSTYLQSRVSDAQLTMN